MKKISVCFDTLGDSTEVYVGDLVLEGPFFSFFSKSKAKKVLVADIAVLKAAKDLANALEAHLIVIEGGEKAKTFSKVQRILDALFEKNFGKDSILIAMGGGVITDLAGFAASIYKRGIPLVLVPTTLMGMVDAAIGGKNAIDTPFGKNLIGTIYQPQAIFVDFQMLRTLPEKQWLNGFFEILKLGLIYDKTIWDLALQEPKSNELILKAIEGKLKIVKQDFKDASLRRILNFGHTIGHAIESAANYEISHGEAVALGCLAESHLSCHLGLLETKDFQEISKAYGRFSIQLPPNYTRDFAFKAMLQDKKAKSDSVRFVLIDRIGQARSFGGEYCQAVSLESLNATFEWMESKYITKKVSIPGSKSYTNRALIIAALTCGTVSIKNPLFSEDTHAMMECLKALGIEIEVGEREILVHGDIFSLKEKDSDLFAYDSGTTMRFLLALLCMIPGKKTIRGNPRLNERPVKDLVDALRSMGASISYLEKEEMLPLQITTSQLLEREVFLKGDVSSQFVSALLLIAPYISGNFTLRMTTPIISKPYVDMTINFMQEAGVKVERKENGYFIPGHPTYQKKEFVIEGDFSSASYFFAKAVLTKSKTTVENLNIRSCQADRKFLDILGKMGNPISYGENSVSLEGKELSPVNIDMEDCPDQIMTMAVLMAFAKGISRISGIRSLRVKESDRVNALKQELSKMGIRAEDTLDTLTVWGGDPKAAIIDTYNDHRIAMAFAIAGTVIPGMKILDPQVVNKTFPSFWNEI